MPNTKLKNKQSINKGLQKYFEKHMIFSVFVIAIFIIIVYSLSNLIMYAPTGRAIHIFILKVIIVVVILFVVKLLLDVFDKDKIIDMRDL